MPTPALTLLSPAKINLHLRVGSPDASGFHPLRSWMITTTLCDEITFSIGPVGDGPARVVLTCDDPSIPCDATNLVARAAMAILRDSPLSRPVAIHLAKRIPAGAGLGGGSSNAATTLIGLNRVLSLNKAAADLHAIATMLGSDVPFFLGPPSAIATGRGEILEAAPIPKLARFAVLVFPPFGISTAAAYRRLDQLRPIAPSDTLDPIPVEAWCERSAHELLHGLLKNDLDLAAFDLEPKLASLKASISSFSKPFIMSGSGSTLFTLCPDEATAQALATEISQKFSIRTVFVELGRPSGFSD